MLTVKESVIDGCYWKLTWPTDEVVIPIYPSPKFIAVVLLNIWALYKFLVRPTDPFPPPLPNLGGGVKRSGEWEVAVVGDDVIVMGDGRALQHLQLFRKKCMWWWTVQTFSLFFSLPPSLSLSLSHKHPHHHHNNCYCPIPAPTLLPLLLLLLLQPVVGIYQM